MQNRIPEDVIDNIRKETDIVDLVGEYVDLKKQGRNFFGLCPFHSENTPSFSVTQDKQIFYCFGCKKGGNVFTFLMELESYTFYESIKLLADRNGIVLPETTKSHETSISKESQSILSAHDWLRRLYHYLLRYTEDGKAGLDYLKNRGISEEIIDEFQLGFAPDIKNMTADFLDKKGFHQQILIKAGILNLQKDNNVLDPYRGRLIFPIRNHLGKTIAFGARTITGQEPKYLNSAESELYQKGRILYNFDLAKKHIRKKSEVILFEGQFDVISVYQAGIKNVIATLGTSLTENQAKLLKRYVDTVILCFDTDKAGVEASFKAAELLRQSNCQVKVAHMKEDMDPDSYIRKYGSESFEREVIKASDTYMGFYIRYMKNKYNLSNEGDRISYIQIVLKQLAMIESAIEREHYLRELSNEYNLSVESLKDEMQAYRRKNDIHKDNRVKNRYTKRASGLTQKRLLPAFQNAERKLLAYMLQDRSVADRVQKDIGVNFNIDEHKIIATHLYAFYEENLEADISLFIDWISDDALQQLVIEISMISLLEEVTEQEINDYIRMIRSQAKSMGHIKEFRDHQKLAEQQNDPIKAAQIAMQIIEIEKRLKNTK